MNFQRDDDDESYLSYRRQWSSVKQVTVDSPGPASTVEFRRKYHNLTHLAIGIIVPQKNFVELSLVLLL